MLSRYMRGVTLRWPLSRKVNKRGVDLVSFEHKCCFLAAGYAVVSMDVRGTGETGRLFITFRFCICRCHFI